MTDIERSTGILRFGLYEVDLRAGELRKGGIKVRLQEQPFQVLALLMRQPGELVTREDIQQEIWGGDTFVDFDHGLNKAISKLREALCDSSTEPRYIETVARRGYRFLAPVMSLRGSIGNGPLTRRVRIAVLPFQNLSGDPKQEFFSDGLTEEMIIQIGQLQPAQLSVIARTSVMPYKGCSKGVQAIGQELQADYVLEGSVRRYEDRVHISAQLVQVSDESCLWAESYESEFTDFLKIQRAVAGKVGASLTLELLPEKKHDVTHQPTTSAVAHEAYLYGRLLWNRRTELFVNEAIRQFSEALKLDPGHARAHAGLAKCYGMLGWYGTISAHEAGEKASAAVQRGLQIDSSLAEVQCSLALVKFWYQWDWLAAETAFRKALERSPNYAAAHHWYGTFLNAMGRFEEAEAAYNSAAELDPKSVTVEKSFADIHLFRREYALAIERLRSVIEHDPRTFSAHYDLGRAYLYSGKYCEAVSAFETAMELSGNLAGTAVLGCALAKAGRRAEAEAILEDLRNPASQRSVSDAGVALILASLGETAQALDWLEQAFAHRCFWFVYLNVDPCYDSLRKEPPFRSLVTRMSFPAIASRDSDFEASA
jgi:TolB-like protein/Tfp pilus assembly protein PilF